jgi:putative aldouronate transport system substrate-binding protein
MQFNLSCNKLRKGAKMSKKRILALLLALVMCLALLSACGDTADDTSTPDDSSSTDATTPAESTGDDEGDVAADLNPGDWFINDDGDVEYVLPLTEDDVTVTVWAPMTEEFQKYANDYSEVVGIQNFMEETGITIEFVSPASDQKNNAFMTMVASGDYPDVLNDVGDLYSTGLTGACDEGLIMELTDVFSGDQAPAYTKMLEDLDVVKNVRDDDGRSYHFANLQNTGSKLTTGLAARKDWMDELGMDKIETYDEWYEYLKGIKANHNATMWATQTGTLSFNALSTGYGTQMFVFSNPGSTPPFIVEDGEVNWGPLKKDAAIEYLTMMNQWWNEGLIYEDFLSVMAPFTADVTPLTSNKVGIAVITAGQFTALNDSGLVDEGFQLWPIYDAVKTEGEVTTYYSYSSIATMNSGKSISVDCENFDLVVKMLDYMYSVKGYSTLCYGVEGETYTINEDGEPRYTDFVLNNPDMTFQEIQNTYFSFDCFAGAASYDAFLATYEDAQQAALEIWNSHTSENTYPTVATMTAEESTEYSNKYSEVQTYAASELTKFVIGDREISEEEYDNFIDTCISLGIEDCIAIKQAAYDRYLAR